MQPRDAKLHARYTREAVHYGRKAPETAAGIKHAPTRWECFKHFPKDRVEMGLKRCQERLANNAPRNGETLVDLADKIDILKYALREGIYYKEG